MGNREALEHLQDFKDLYAAHCRENWHPNPSPPEATLMWISVAPLLLAFCERLIKENGI